jgi:hypothetical protein
VGHGSAFVKVEEQSLHCATSLRAHDWLRSCRYPNRYAPIRSQFSH